MAVKTVFPKMVGFLKKKMAGISLMCRQEEGL
jgi:hypothetical protein